MVQDLHRTLRHKKVFVFSLQSTERSIVLPQFVGGYVIHLRQEPTPPSRSLAITYPRESGTIVNRHSQEILQITLIYFSSNKDYGTAY